MRCYAKLTDAHCKTSEIWSVIPRVCIPLQCIRECVERCGREASIVDVGERPGQAAVSHAKQVVIRRGRLECGDQGQGVETTPVMVDLAFDSLEFSAVDVVPNISMNNRREPDGMAKSYQYLLAFPL